MSSVVIAGNTSGTITLDAPNVAGTTVLTLPTANGTVLTTANTFAAGTGPAFSAYGTAFQSAANNTYTKIQYNTEEFDTNSNYDNATNYRFTPTIAGYYQINSTISFAGGGGSTFAGIYKNGSLFKWGDVIPNNVSTGAVCQVNALVYFNGSTDYVEIFGYQSSGGALNIGSNANTQAFSAAMVRGA
jgi:hypothetical protein